MVRKPKKRVLLRKIVTEWGLKHVDSSWEVRRDVQRFVVYKFRSMKKAFDFAQYGIRINQIGTIVASIKHQFHGFFLSDRLIAAP